MAATVEVRRGAYYDSVSLMRVSRAVADVEGVEAALVAMATELNLELLDGMGFERPDAGAADLLVAIRARDDDAAAAAADVLARALADAAGGAATRGGSGAEAPARTIRTAARAAGAGVALISVPGRHAYVEAVEAVEAGLHPLLFSDNVPVEQEIALKDLAAERGLLVMGPDCGTAHVGGVGLGFANAVRPGPVGVVAASGTGAQQLMCLLDAAGTGISHVLGVGGRDLSEPVGARSTLRALAALGADPATEVVVVVAKPPAPAVAARVEAAAAALGKPVLTALLGTGGDDLTAITHRVLAALGHDPAVAWPRWPAQGRPARAAQPGALRGLFAGGTLCDEAMLIAAGTLGPVRSNVPLQPGWALPGDLRSPGHLMIDFGDDRLTAGRPHPMVDSTLRLDRLRAEAADPDTAVVLLDVVLGYAAHPDPAAEWAPAITAALAAAGRPLSFVVSLCGTRGDPQDLERQASRLCAAGADVFLSNAEAARHAAALASGAGA